MHFDLSHSGVKIFQANEIYHLVDQFNSHREQMKQLNQEKHQHLAVFPCQLKILPQYIFNTRDPIICGVRVEEGFIKLGTPICVPSKDVCVRILRLSLSIDIYLVYRIGSNC